MAQASDRHFLDEMCGALHEKVKQKILEDPTKKIHEQDFQDFEVSYSIDAADTRMRLKIHYDFLSDVLAAGSQSLLERAWDGFPFELAIEPKCLTVGLDVAQLGDDMELRQRCVRQLMMSRQWLLIGPLVERLIWLRDQTASLAAGVGAKEECPPLCKLVVRTSETCWIIVKPDRVMIVFSIHLDDEVDVSIGRVFCMEFAETNRAPTAFTLPCSFSEPKDPPGDVRGALSSVPNVGFLAFTISDQAVRGATEERLHQLAKPVMCFRNFFHFHLKNTKSYLHSRLRKRLTGWEQQMNRARRKKEGKEQRRTVTGKVFDPNLARA